VRRGAAEAADALLIEAIDQESFNHRHEGLPCYSCCLLSTDRRDYLTSYLLSQARRDGVAELRLDACAVAHQLEVVGEGEEPLDLADTQSAVLPVEGAGARARPGLKGLEEWPGGLATAGRPAWYGVMTCWR